MGGGGVRKIINIDGGGGGGGGVSMYTFTVSGTIMLRSESMQMTHSLLDPQVGWPSRFTKVQCCGGLSMVSLQLKD